MPGTTASLFKRLLAGKNLRLQSFVNIRCRDSYIPFAKWLPFMNDTGKPDADSLARVERFVSTAMVDGTDRRRTLFNPFNLAHWLGQVAPDDGPRMLLGRRMFLKEACVLCGQCVALCPSGAITQEAGKIRFDETRCVGCCCCLNICPQNAWRSARFGPEYFSKGMHVPAMAKALERLGSIAEANDSQGASPRAATAAAGGIPVRAAKVHNFSTTIHRRGHEKTCIAACSGL